MKSLTRIYRASQVIRDSAGHTMSLAESAVEAADKFGISGIRELYPELEGLREFIEIFGSVENTVDALILIENRIKSLDDLNANAGEEVTEALKRKFPDMDPDKAGDILYYLVSIYQYSGNMGSVNEAIRIAASTGDGEAVKNAEELDIETLRKLTIKARWDAPRGGHAFKPKDSFNAGIWTAVLFAIFFAFAWLTFTELPAADNINILVSAVLAVIAVHFFWSSLRFHSVFWNTTNALVRNGITYDEELPRLEVARSTDGYRHPAVVGMKSKSTERLIDIHEGTASHFRGMVLMMPLVEWIVTLGKMTHLKSSVARKEGYLSSPPEGGAPKAAPKEGRFEFPDEGPRAIATQSVPRPGVVPGAGDTAGPDTERTSGIAERIELLQGHLNSERAIFIRDLKQAYALLGMEATFGQDSVSEEAVKALDTISGKPGSPDLPSEITDEDKREAARIIADLEGKKDAYVADGLVGDIIVLARKAAREDQKLIIGLETGWIPGLTDRGSLQQNAITPLVREVEDLEEKLRAMGLENVIFIHKDGNELVRAIEDERGRTSTDLRNVVVLASRDTAASSEAGFDALRGEGENSAFIAEVDPTELMEFYEREGEAVDKQLNIRLTEMLCLTLELAAGKDPVSELSWVGVQLDRETRTVIFIPRVAPVNYEKLKEIYRMKRLALQSA